MKNNYKNTIAMLKKSDRVIVQRSKDGDIWSWENKMPFEEKQKEVEKLLKEFCKLNGGVIYE